MIGEVLYNLSLMFGHKEQKRPVYETFPQQESIKRISSEEVRKIVLDTTGIEVKCGFDNSDISYKQVDIQTLKIFTAKNNLARYKYIETERDCDDFEYMCQGDTTHWDPDLAFGIIWGVKPNGKGHAWNWCIGTDGGLWFIEPQGNHVFKPDKLWKITLLIM